MDHRNETPLEQRARLTQEIITTITARIAANRMKTLSIGWEMLESTTVDTYTGQFFPVVKIDFIHED
jgi:hypothetical protein